MASYDVWSAEAVQCSGEEFPQFCQLDTELQSDTESEPCSERSLPPGPDVYLTGPGGEGAELRSLIRDATSC